MTTFTVGQFVSSRVQTQGLVQNAVYQVVEIQEQRTAFGNFVTYVLKGMDEQLRFVRNGHLLLEPVV